VGRVLPILLVSLGHPRWHGCWTDAMRLSEDVNWTLMRVERSNRTILSSLGKGDVLRR
jgi:hypothetical protein